MTGRKKTAHGGARPGAGRPARSANGASSKYTLLLSDDERWLLEKLSVLLGVSESDVMRRGLVELAARHGVTLPITAADRRAIISHIEKAGSISATEAAALVSKRQRRRLKP